MFQISSDSFRTELAESLYKEAMKLKTPWQVLDRYTEELEKPSSQKNDELWTHYIYLHFKINNDTDETKELLNVLRANDKNLDMWILRAYIECKADNQNKARQILVEIGREDLTDSVIDGTIENISPCLGKLKRLIEMKRNANTVIDISSINSSATKPEQNRSSLGQPERIVCTPEKKAQTTPVNPTRLHINRSGPLNQSNFKRNLTMEFTTNLSNIKENIAPELNKPDIKPSPKPIEKLRTIIINNKMYYLLQIIGKGGSSKVLRVLSDTGELLALKRVRTKFLDKTVLNGYLNEIELLRRFSEKRHIIKLIDADINTKSGYIYIILECGEIDLASMLRNRMTFKGHVCDMNFIRFCWEQILRAVAEIHAERIVHRDLKPANFVLVKGRLKLIDFGISRAIKNDTTNIVNENQMGTVNYMSPEALIDNGEGEYTKMGRSSDVWSLGCILYEMCYGEPPFASFGLMQRFHKIVDVEHRIEYKHLENVHLLDALKGCLQRDPKKRVSIDNLLNHPFLFPEIFS
eukprot:GHVP01023298.1.p1 GENE.GHVP01023298.1~~GHVP01023298.1.p1  ORF type:complete len:522 (+),score=75.28 GHVP01023298.1:1281-2846(+)